MVRQTGASACMLPLPFIPKCRKTWPLKEAGEEVARDHARLVARRADAAMARDGQGWHARRHQEVVRPSTREAQFIPGLPGTSHGDGDASSGGMHVLRLRRRRSQKQEDALCVLARPRHCARHSACGTSRASATWPRGARSSSDALRRIAPQQVCVDTDCVCVAHVAVSH